MNPSANSPTERPGHRSPPGPAHNPSAPDYYHALFNSTDQGFCVLELQFDATGQTVVDCIYRQANPVFSQQSGIPMDVVGRSALEVMPDLEHFWFDTYGRVARTGESERLEQYVPPVGRWFDVHTFRVGGPGSREVGVLFHDVTARKQAAATDAFRLRLADALGPLSDPVAIQEAVTRLAQQHFAADRCYYVEIEGGLGIIRRDAAADGLPSLAGTYPYADFALLQAVFQAGRPFSVRDVRQDASVDETLRQLCVQLQLISYLDVPILKNGQPAGVLCLVQSQPRDWTAAELTLAAEVAERTWAAVERAHAEASLTQSEAKYRSLFDSIDEGFATLEVLFDAAGQATDYRILDMNSAYEKAMGMPRTAVGQRVRELVPEAEEAMLRRYGEVALTGEPVRFEQHVAALGRWFDVFSSRMGGAGSRTVACVFTDITARKQQAQQQAFLLRFSDALRAETSATSVVYQALGMLCEQLRLDRCYVGIYDLAGDRGIFPHQVGNDRIPPLPAEVRLSDFPDALRVAHDQTLRIDDLAQTEGLSDTDRQNLGALGMRALVAASLRRGADGPQWSIVALSADVRHWTPGEVALLEEATERTWAAVQRAQAEEARRQSEEEFRLLVTTTSDTVYRMSADCTQLEQLLGKDFLADTLSPSRTWTTQYIPDEDQPRVQAAIADAIARKGPLELEHRVQQADGTVGWAHSRAVPVLDAQGEVTGWLGAATNITASKQAEEALRESEARFRAVANLVPDLLWRSTPDSDTTWYNQRWYEYTGQTPAEAARYGWTNAIHPADRAASSHRYHTAVGSGQALRQEHRIRSAQGEYRWFQVQALPLRNEHGTVTAWYGAATDIHARKLAEEDLRHAEESHRAELEQQVAARTQELRESRDLLHGIAESQSASISAFKAVRDEHGRVVDLEYVFVNTPTQQIAGGRPLVGRRYLEEFPEAENAGFLDSFRRVIETGVGEDRELPYHDDKLTVWFRSNATKLDDGVLVVGEDVTPRKQAEQERLKTLRLLEQAEAVAGLGSWDYDRLSQEVRWSEGMYRLFGLPVGQPVRPDIYLQFVVDEDRVRAEDLVRHVQTGDGNFEETLRLRVGEQLKTVRIKSVVLHNEAGQPVRVLGVDLDISQLQRLEDDNLRLRLTQQQALFEAVQAAQEEERRRMAESLHNGIGQMLFATKLRLDQLHAPVLHTLPALAAARNEADQLLSEAIRQTRALSHELVPLALKEFGLVQALLDIGRKMSTPQLQLRSQVVYDEDAAPLSAALQMALYRMAQELAQNIVKHATGATEASLELETMPGWVLLRAEDNGAGFTPESAERPGLGLRSIRDRVALLGGQVNTGAAAAGGAYVRIRIPLFDSPSL
ncbi:PAS domain S-box protein [Hymenobacter bucti]|uniref:histidine kinase n=1 Tax=Hymenobacter bucti TaxID=1844114 RepID=A0ABW4QZN8_9BACT